MGATVTGLQGAGLVLRLNGVEDVAAAADGSITFATSLASGQAYDVSIATQPSGPSQTCRVLDGNGLVAGGPVDVVVTCHAPTGRFLYVINRFSRDVSGFAIDVRTGALTEIPGSPFPVTAGALPYASYAAPGGRFLYVVGADTTPQPPTPGSPSTIVGFAIDADSGALTPAPGGAVTLPFFATDAPAFHPSGHFFAIAATAAPTSGPPPADPANAVHVFSIDPATGALSSAPGSPYGTPDGEHVRRPVYDPDGEFLYVPRGNPPGMGVAVFSVDATTGALTHKATTPVSVHINQIEIHPSGHFLYTRDGIPQTSILAIDEATGAATLKGAVPAPTGLGIVFAAGGRFAYMNAPDTSNVQGPGIIEGYAVDVVTGALTPLADSPYATNGNLASLIATDPAGRHVVATNFLSGTVAILAVDEATGTLSHIASSPFTPAVGTTPGLVAFEPAGRFAYLVDGGTASISTYAIDPDSGEPLYVDTDALGSGPGASASIVGLQ
ncbi:MAG TPA: beta-propeller fold lactonase family protein [Gammaproteobacteria bacterium]